MFFRCLNLCLFFIVWMNFLLDKCVICMLLILLIVILYCVVLIDGLVIFVFIIELNLFVNGMEKLFVL